MVRRTTITPLEEYKIVLLRFVLFLSLDDLVAVVHAKINPNLTRASIARCLQRYHLDNLDWLIKKIVNLQDKTDNGKCFPSTLTDNPTFKRLGAKYKNIPFLVCFEITNQYEDNTFFFYVQPALKAVIYADVCPRKRLDERRRLHRERLSGFSYVVLSDHNKRVTDLFDLILANLPNLRSALLPEDKRLETLKTYVDAIRSEISIHFYFNVKTWIEFFTEVFEFVNQINLPYDKSILIMGKYEAGFNDCWLASWLAIKNYPFPDFTKDVFGDVI